MFNVLFNFFDILLIAFLIYLNARLWNKKLHKLSIYILLILILGIACPIISFIIEWELNSQVHDDAFDAFTMLYTLFKFPIYWFIFFIQIAIINTPLRKKIFNYQKE